MPPVYPSNPAPTKFALGQLDGASGCNPMLGASAGGAARGGERSFTMSCANGKVAPGAVAGTRVDLRKLKFDMRADPPLYRDLRERCRNRGAWMAVLSRTR